MSILGCGYLGLPVAQELVARGWRVRGSTTREERLQELLASGIEPFLVQLTPGIEGRGLADFFSSEYLFVNFPPGRRRPDVEGFLWAAVQALMERLTDVKVLVFASSTSVYASGNVKEADVQEPLTASGRALQAAEATLMGQSEAATTVLRFGGLYGYTRKPGRFMQNVQNGAGRVNLVHRDDAVGVVVRVLESPPTSEIFNVVTDKHPRRDEFYRQAAAWLGKEAPPVTYAPVGTGKVVMNDKIKQHLGYEFLHPDPMQPAP